MNPAELVVILCGAMVAGLGGALLSRHLPWLRLNAVTAQVLAVSIVILWTALVGTMAVLQHLSFHTHAYDLAIFDQVVWNSAHGRLFQNSVMADSPSFLGHHFSPILLALVPLYWIHPSATTLLVAQALLLGLAGLPFYWLARALLHSEGLAIAILLAYLLHPATAYIALFDFHEIAFTIPLLAVALCLMLRQRYILFIVALSLAFLSKEELGLVGAAIGVYIAVAQGRRVGGLALAAVGCLWTLLLTRYVIPSFHPSGQYYFSSLYANLGATPLAALHTVVFDPSRAFAQALSAEKQVYIQQLFAPLGALPLLGWPVLCVALPSFAFISLSGMLPGDLIQAQYSATILPPLLVASIKGLQWLRERTKPGWNTLAPGATGFVIGAAALGAYLYGPLPFAQGFVAEHYQRAPRLEAARQLIAMIPPQASVIAQSDLVPQLSHRRTIQLFGMSDPSLRPDYYFFDTDSKSSRWPLSYEDKPYFEAIARVTSDAEYQVVAEREGYLLVKHETPYIPGRVGVTFGGQITLVGYRLGTLPVSPGGTLNLALYWQAERKPDADYTAFIQLFDGNNKRWGQRDTYPTGTFLPTSSWEPGRLLHADYAIPVPAEAPPGGYHVLVGLYNLANMQRLPASSADAAANGNAVNIPSIGIVAR